MLQSKQRRELLAEIKREQKRQATVTLAGIRAAIRDVKARRKAARARALAVCRAERTNVKERAKLARAALRTQIEKEKLEARTACTVRKTEIKQSGESAERQEQKRLAEERRLQAEVRRIDARLAKRETKGRTTARERKQESDDEVRRNLPPELLALFERIKKSIKGSARISRTEEVLHFAEEHPDEVVNAIEGISDRELRHLQAEEARIYADQQAKPRAVVRVRSRPARAKLRRERLVIEVPF